MESIKIKIGAVEYQIRQSFRALMLFENLTGKPVSESKDSVNTLMLMFYCILKSNNKDFEYSFETFVDLIDDNSDSIEVFSNYLQGLNKPEKTKKK